MPRKLNPVLVAEKLDVGKFVDCLSIILCNTDRGFRSTATLRFCCGVKELSAVWIDGLYRHCLKQRPMLTADEFMSVLQHLFDEWGLTMCAGVVVTTIPSQKKVIATLTKLGFTHIVVNKNPTTKRLITVWVRSV